MIYSGLLIYWANDVYAVQVGRWTLFHFFPDWFYRVLHVPHRLAEGMAWHFAFMWLFALNGFVYVSYTFITGEWRYLIPNRDTPRDAWQVVLHDLGVRKEPLPHRKFNGAQRFAYTGVVVDGGGVAHHRPGDLQAGATGLADLAAAAATSGPGSSTSRSRSATSVSS